MMIYGLSVVLTLLMAYAFYRSLRGAAFFGSLLRILSTTGVAVVLLLTYTSAVAVERVILGLAAAVVFTEAYNRVRPFGPRPTLTSTINFIPVAIPLLLFAPYATMVGYFFGMDRWLLCFALLVLVIYALPRSWSSGRKGAFTSFLLAATSVALLFGMAGLR